MSRRRWLSLGAIGAMTFAVMLPAFGQVSTVIHSFSGLDGRGPVGSLAIDDSGNLYGTTEEGGASNQGTVFELSRGSGGTWTETVLYSFAGGSDGGFPFDGVMRDSAGNLFGTTSNGGGGSCSAGCGTVFELSPTSGGWTKQTLHTFQGSPDGAGPFSGLAMDPSGNLFGMTEQGGLHGSEKGGYGTLYELSPDGSGGWTYNVLLNFNGTTTGYLPADTPFVDKLGDVYGTTFFGGTNGVGLVFRLVKTPTGWGAHIIHSFGGSTDPGEPHSLALGPDGGLYATAGGQGTVFDLLYTGTGWQENVIHTFNPSAIEGAYPESTPVFHGGKLYATTSAGGAFDGGTLFELTQSGMTWTEKVLHMFSGGSDGGSPVGKPVFDKSGNLYGVAAQGGDHGAGVVYKLHP